MRIVALIEDTVGVPGCVPAHGLAFYIETAKHRLLSDLGPSALSLENAERLGIDLTRVDTVVLSHGHYDHGGGILPFAARNPAAAIWLRRTALGEYYSDDGEEAQPRWRYIGVDPRIAALPQLRFLDGDRVIDGELSVFGLERPAEPQPFGSDRLKEKRGEAYVQDRFGHEQFLVLREGSRRVLLSGCAHGGILNVLEAFRSKYGGEPDAVLSGFHLSRKRAYTPAELAAIRALAEGLKRFRTAFYTCHCTGLPAYEIMKPILGEQLQYVHTGQELRL